jgi:hypothetical protein
MTSPLATSINFQSAGVSPSSIDPNIVSSVSKRRRHVIPIIDTTKLLSIEVKAREPLMDSLLSPTTLEARLRQNTRVLKHDFEDATRHAFNFQQEIDSLAEEAEQVGAIGPIVLPDEDPAQSLKNGLNPNRVGFVDEVFGEEIRDEKERQKLISLVRKRHDRDVVDVRQKKKNKQLKKRQLDQFFNDSDDDDDDDDDNNDPSRWYSDAARRKSSVLLPRREFTENFREKSLASSFQTNVRNQADANEEENKGTLLPHTNSLFQDERNQQSHSFVVVGNVTSVPHLEMSVSSSTLIDQSQNHHGPVVLIDFEGKSFSASRRRMEKNTSDYISGVTAGDPLNSSSSFNHNPLPAAREVTGGIGLVLAAERTYSVAGSRSQRNQMEFVRSDSPPSQEQRRQQQQEEEAKKNELQKQSASAWRRRLQEEQEREERELSLLQEEQEQKANGNFRISDIVVEDVESDSDSVVADVAASRIQRNQIEQAQLEIVQRIRFVPPRSVAPSQLDEVIKATCSVANFAARNKNDDLEVPLYPTLNDEEEQEWRSRVWNKNGKYNYASSSNLSKKNETEKPKKMSLSELLNQQKEMMAKLEKARPEYEKMMDDSVALLEMQKKTMEERCALIS